MKITRQIRLCIKQALAEDCAAGDITTTLTILPTTKINAKIIAKEKGILCGAGLARETFKLSNGAIRVRLKKKDGSRFNKNDTLITISGNARAILSAERVALNFLSHLSGVATLTAKFVAKIKRKKAKILDTRKTIPNLRRLQKYAVKVGGGTNHRQSLADAILIKDNHLRAASFITGGDVNYAKLATAIARLRTKTRLRLQIEVENLTQFKAIGAACPDIILLDNFSPKDIRRAVIFRNKHFPRVKLEASGNISLSNVGRIASSGVDYISLGCLTHSSSAVDLSLEVING